MQEAGLRRRMRRTRTGTTADQFQSTRIVRESCANAPNQSSILLLGAGGVILSTIRTRSASDEASIFCMILRR